jgi:hypothetical protein
MDNIDNNKKLILIALVLISSLLVIILLVNVFKKNNNSNNTGNVQGENSNNYVETAEGNKVNTSEEVASDKTVGNILLEKNAIVYENGISKLTSKITNDSIAKENLRFKVKFIANDGNVIAESVGFVGTIGANETKYIESNITKDVSNAKSITYEIMQ